jgi:uncharacterized RDD family membrane protein YckC
VSLDNTAQVDTPEQIRFEYRVAGPARRGLAYLIDLLLRAAIAVGAFMLIGLAFGVKVETAREASQGVQLLVIFLLEWGYYVVCETLRNGSSPGKRALSLRVVKEGGYPLGFVDSLLRNLLRAADFLPMGYALAVLVMGGDRRFRRLGDRLAGTMVVIEDRASVGRALALDPPPAASELAALPHRPPLSPSERDAIEQLLRRRDLAAARRGELAEMVAPLFADRMGLPRPTDPLRFLELVHHRLTAPRAQARGQA